MRWVAGLFALCLAMAWLHHLTAASALDARAAFALGFLVISAWVAGEIAARARLPRLTGFLILGLCVGPAWLTLVRQDELDVLGFVAHAAIAWIAFAAGQELELTTLRAERRVLSRFAAGTLAFPMLAVAAVVLSVAPWFPLTAHQGARNAVGVALTLGACAAAASPIVVISVWEELGTGGALAERVLRVAAVNTVAVTGLLTLVLLAARGIGNPGTVDGAVAPAFAARAAGALGVGAVLGVLASRYSRVAPRDAMLVLVGLGFVVAMAQSGLGLEPTLVALAAGVAARNAGGPGGAALRAAANQSALVTQTVFFALAGAALRVGALEELWPWVVLLAGLRVVALRYGTLWAGRSGAVDLARRSWLGLVSQSGIAMALAAAARRAFPAWGVSLEALVAGCVLINELAGPLCLYWILQREGVGRPQALDPIGGRAGRALAEWVPRPARGRSVFPRGAGRGRLNAAP
ncbi:MAG TPA: cation:proton antiporter [Gemmatimonadales bacterium]|nr:cation:proton antiporter [Gemmatimonadales bacterium]